MECAVRDYLGVNYDIVCGPFSVVVAVACCPEIVKLPGNCLCEPLDERF